MEKKLDININGIWGFSGRYNQQSDIWMCVWKWVLPGIWQFLGEMMRNHGIWGVPEWWRGGDSQELDVNQYNGDTTNTC